MTKNTEFYIGLHLEWHLYQLKDVRFRAVNLREFIKSCENNKKWLCIIQILIQLFIVPSTFIALNRTSLVQMPLQMYVELRDKEINFRY